MHTSNLSFPKLFLMSLSLVMVAGIGIPVRGQTGTVDDWTHHHLVFSNPGSATEAEARGNFDQWTRVVNSPRFQLQQLKRSLGTKAFLNTGRDGLKGFPKPEQKGNTLHQDWSQPLVTGGRVQPNAFPAKFSFDTTTADCTNDYVAYPTGAAATATAANIFADSNLYSGCGGTVPGVDWAYNTGTSVGTGYAVVTSPVLSYDGSELAFVESNGTTASLVLLKPAPSPTTFTTTGGVTATSVNFSFTSGTITAADIGAQISGSLTGIPANDTIASITGPTTGTLATAATVTRATETLTVHAETFALPGVPPAAASAGAYATCTAPCMFAMSLGADDTNSAPFYDYTPGDDTIYVGDDTSYLHKFTGVFNGTPTEVTKIQLNTTSYLLAPPVYDYVSGCVFVGDNQGYLYSANSGTAGTVCTSTTFSTRGHSEILSDSTTTANEGIFDAVLLDSTSQMVYVFVTDSAARGSCAATDNCVDQFTTSTITQGATTSVPAGGEPLGTGAANYNIYDGAFDNVYYSSASGNAGNLWVMGNTGAPGGNLYKVPISGTSTMSAPVEVFAGLTDATTGHYAFSSPITEFCNNNASPCTASGTATTAGTDYIFFSVDRLATATANCGTASTDGCILAYSVNTPNASPYAKPVGSEQVVTLGTPGCWSTGGFVVDNSVPSGTLAGASEIYWFGLNGNSAGGPNGNAGSSCTSTTTTNIPNAIQDLQTL